jgi:UDP-N-acetylmuramoyl-tripeptide--D-alanyl-D-alanine ligase
MQTSPIAFRDFLDWTRGDAAAGLPASFTGVCYDSRILKPGELFVALRSEERDGHAYVPMALAKGASAALVASDWAVPGNLAGAPLIRVADPLVALADAARAWRLRCRARAIGLTGSVGKTTTKELTAALLAANGGKVAATSGNLNNSIGLPISLLTLAPDTDFGVFETGTNHPGEIARLADILRPDAAILTNIGTAHIEHFGTQAGIAQEKGTLFEALPEDGFAVLPLETVCFDALKARTSARVFTTSLLSDEADYRGVCLDAGTGRVRITERATGAATELVSNLPGEHNASNLLLAFAVARQCGIPAGACAAALAHFKLPGMRWAVSEKNGITVINDAYNANPQSMAASLKTFAARPCKGRRIAVLGDMLELGAQSETLHRGVGREAAAAKLDLLITVGPLAKRFIADEARKTVPALAVESFDDAVSARAPFSALLRPGDTVLLKASRGIALERILP